MSKYIIDISRNNSNNGDNKPKKDVAKILEKDLNFKLIYVKKYKHSKIDQNFFIKYRIKKSLDKLKLSSEDTVLINYPIYSGKKFEESLIEYLKQRKVNSVVLIHDLDSLRFNWSVMGDISDEVKYLNKYNYVISHNSKMEKILVDNGLNTKLINIGIFDYLSNEKSKTNSYKYKENITFAGNLNKSMFLKQLKVKSPIKFQLFGPIDDKNNINSSISYYGSVTPEKLSECMGQGFGLVWDGDSVDTISGNIGNYLKYNNPYKVSSYISAGMPVIVWNKSAVNDFVIDNKIGISVSSLDDIGSRISKITESEYDEMIENVNLIKKKINSGFYISSALKKICK